jgi:hypothetical protein
MKTAANPAYSPDITPSDFYFIGYVKGCLTGRSFVDAEELLREFERFSIASESDFASGVSRVNRLIEELHPDHGGYTEEARKQSLQIRLSLTR